MPLTEDQARKRVEELKGYYGNLAAYAIVIPGLVLVDWLTGPGAWAFWPALGWGLGLVSHTVATFGVFGSQQWEERKVRELTGDADASASRLRALVREAVGERAPRADDADDADRLRRRLEHLEAIVTSRDFDAFVDERDTPPLLAVPDDEEAGAEARAARLARRVR